MEEERRISIKVPREIFRQLDLKRAEEEVYFQDVGLRLFKAWLAGEVQAQPELPLLSRDELSLVRTFIRYMRESQEPSMFLEALRLWGAKNPPKEGSDTPEDEGESRQ